MNKKFIFFNVFAVLSAIMPFHCFADTGCASTVDFAAGKKWMGGSAVMTRRMANEEELKVEDDTAIYNKHKKSIPTIKEQLDKKSKQELDNKVYPDDASGTLTCGSYMIALEDCRGKTLKQCNKDCYDTSLSVKYKANELHAEQQARTNYINELKETICGGTSSLSAADKKAVEDEKKFQSSGMVSDSTSTAKPNNNTKRGTAKTDKSTKNANGCADGDTKCSKAATKAETKLEKDFETDMNVLHTEFLSIIKSLINECKTKGGTIADSGECQVAAQK